MAAAASAAVRRRRLRADAAPSGSAARGSPSISSTGPALTGSAGSRSTGSGSGSGVDRLGLGSSPARARAPARARSRLRLGLDGLRLGRHGRRSGSRRRHRSGSGLDPLGLGEDDPLPGLRLEQRLEHVAEVHPALDAQVLREPLDRGGPPLRHLGRVEAVHVGEGLVGHAAAQREVEYLPLTRVQPLEGGGELFTIDQGRACLLRVYERYGRIPPLCIGSGTAEEEGRRMAQAPRASATSTTVPNVPASTAITPTSCGEGPP